MFLPRWGQRGRRPRPCVRGWGASQCVQLVPKDQHLWGRGCQPGEGGTEGPFLRVPALTLMTGAQPPAGTWLPSLCLPRPVPGPSTCQLSLHFCSCGHALLPGQGGVLGAGATPPNPRLAEAGVLRGLDGGEGPASSSLLSKNDWFPEGLWEGKSGFGFCDREAGSRATSSPPPPVIL